jgi:hypothetical protein
MRPGQSRSAAMICGRRHLRWKSAPRAPQAASESSSDRGDSGGRCGLVGRATTFVGGDVGSIPTCGALEVRQWTFGSGTVWLVKAHQLGNPSFEPRRG